MSNPVKVSGCGTVVRMDFGSGFITQGLCDSVTPWGQTKAIIDTPTLDCESAAEVGRQEQSTLVFNQYWDIQDVDQELVNTNFEESTTDGSKKDVPVQVVTQSYSSDGGAASTATLEATCQISDIAPEEVTPEGHFKRGVTVVRTGAITKTITPT